MSHNSQTEDSTEYTNEYTNETHSETEYHKNYTENEDENEDKSMTISDSYVIIDVNETEINETEINETESESNANEINETESAYETIVDESIEFDESNETSSDSNDINKSKRKRLLFTVPMIVAMSVSSFYLIMTIVAITLCLVNNHNMKNARKLYN